MRLRGPSREFVIVSFLLAFGLCLTANHAFARVNRTLTQQQRDALRQLRNLDGYVSAPAYIYSAPLQEAVRLPDTEHFFFPPKTRDEDLK